MKTLMTQFITLLFILVIPGFQVFSQVGMNADGSLPDQSAGLDVKFSNKGFLPPRMTQAQLNAIVSPADGLVVYCTNCGSNGLGAMSICMAGIWYTIGTSCLNPFSPLTGTHVASPTQIVWNWNAVSGAAGYKWGATNDYATAADIGTNTSKTETGLNCLTLYSRYVWAYNSCGVSNSVTLSKSTTGTIINAPTPGTHVASLTQIIWKWNTVAGATGYRWGPSNDFASAVDLGSSLLIAEAGLTCNTNYTRYLWAYGECGNSTATTLTQATLNTPVSAPTAGTHVSTPAQISWNWNTVSGATGYKWSVTNNYTTAEDMGTTTTKTEAGLTCNTAYSRYIWAYNACGISTSLTLSQSTSSCSFTCGSSFTIFHVAGPVAPVTKTVVYATVTNIPGEPAKCWITSNLGASHQATAVSDATEASAGWYWQFNAKQGYKHTGATRTPNSTWISSISENSDWTTINDPCAIELGAGWRIPTSTEWTNVDASGGWTNWNGPWNSGLKMHAAGVLNFDDGSLNQRGSTGFCWSNAQYVSAHAWYLEFSVDNSSVTWLVKSYGYSLRCIR